MTRTPEERERLCAEHYITVIHHGAELWRAFQSLHHKTTDNYADSGFVQGRTLAIDMVLDTLVGPAPERSGLAAMAPPGYFERAASSKDAHPVESILSVHTVATRHKIALTNNWDSRPLAMGHGRAVVAITQQDAVCEVLIQAYGIVAEQTADTRWGAYSVTGTTVKMFTSMPMHVTYATLWEAVVTTADLVLQGRVGG